MNILHVSNTTITHWMEHLSEKGGVFPHPPGGLTKAGHHGFGLGSWRGSSPLENFFCIDTLFSSENIGVPNVCLLSNRTPRNKSYVLKFRMCGCVVWFLYLVQKLRSIMGNATNTNTIYLLVPLRIFQQGIFSSWIEGFNVASYRASTIFILHVRQLADALQ